MFYIYVSWYKIIILVIVSISFSFLTQMSYGQSTPRYGIDDDDNVILTPQHERWKDILKEEGDKAFQKQCISEMGGDELSFLCDAMKDTLVEVIVNESSIAEIDNASSTNISGGPEAYETYTDEIAGFSLQNPADWNLDNSSSPNISLFYKGTREFGVRLWDNPEIFSVLDVRDVGETAQDTATDDENEKLEESLHSYDKGIDGEEAVTFTYSESGIMKKVVSVIHDDRAYDFTYSSVEVNFDDDQEIMNHFFDSISFN